MTFELFSLDGKRAFVTGSSQGIGLSVAIGLAAHGADVILNGRDATKLDADATPLSGQGYPVGHRCLT